MSRLALVVEGSSDERRLRYLVDTWCRENGVSPVVWVGPDDSKRFYQKKDLAEYVSRRPRRIRLSRKGLEGVLRQTVLLFQDLLSEGRFDGVVVVLDTEGTAVNRVRDLDLGRLASGIMCPQEAVGIAHESMESWVVRGLIPSPEERKSEKRCLSFDPFNAPEHLSHKEYHPKSAKRCLGRVDHDEEQCMARLWALSSRDETGCSAFLVELEALLRRVTSPTV